MKMIMISKMMRKDSKSDDGATIQRGARCHGAELDDAREATARYPPCGIMPMPSKQYINININIYILANTVKITLNIVERRKRSIGGDHGRGRPIIESQEALGSRTKGLVSLYTNTNQNQAFLMIKKREKGKQRGVTRGRN